MEECRGSTSYYSILGLSPSCSNGEIRRAYHKLAMQWHPDRWTKTPSLLGEAKRKFQQIQEAYEVLSDLRKRTLYDAGLYDPDDEYDEGFSDFAQEMFSLMTQVRPEEKNCTMEDLQKMFVEMAQDFDISLSSCESLVFDEPCRDSPFKRMRWDSNLKTSSPPFGVPEFAIYGAGDCCNRCFAPAQLSSRFVQGYERDI